jgi:hypothetical protein
MESFKLLVGPFTSSNMCYSLEVDLCHEATLISIDESPALTTGDRWLTFNFEVPEGAPARNEWGSRSFELWSVREVDAEHHYPHNVFVGAFAGAFVFENSNYENEVQQEEQQLYWGTREDEDLVEIADISTRARLWLCRSPITNAGVEIIAALAVNVEDLSLAGSNITDDGLLPLSKLANLKRLDISYTSVSASKVRELKLLMPPSVR